MVRVQSTFWLHAKSLVVSVLRILLMLGHPMKPDSKLASMFCFLKNQSGAAMIEYSILIGMITVAAITLIITVGEWVAVQWQTVQTAVGIAGT